jgi:hypothetical protein
MQLEGYWLWVTVKDRPLPECYEENPASLVNVDALIP